MLKEQHFDIYNVPDESVDNYSWHRCKVYLGYTISLILDGNKDLLKKYYLDLAVSKEQIGFLIQKSHMD